MRQPPEQAHSTLQVRVHPRSASSRHAWGDDGLLHVWVTAPAVEGAANRALRQHLAVALDIAPSGVQIERGQTSRIKRLRIEMAEETLRDRLQNSSK